MSCPLEIRGNNTHLKSVDSNAPSPLRVLLLEKLTFSSVSGKDYSLCPSLGEEHCCPYVTERDKDVGGWGGVGEGVRVRSITCSLFRGLNPSRIDCSPGGSTSSCHPLGIHGEGHTHQDWRR